MNEPASTEGGRNNGLNIRGERLLAHTVCVACVTRGTSPSLSLSLSLSPPLSFSFSSSSSFSFLFLFSFSFPSLFRLLFFLLIPLWRRLVVERAEKERRESIQGVWMEEQCTPYINIVPITRSPGGYRSWKTPTNFGRRTNHAAPLSLSLSLLLSATGCSFSDVSCCGLRSQMKKRGRDPTDLPSGLSAMIIYGHSSQFPKRFFLHYSLPIARFSVRFWRERVREREREKRSSRSATFQYR